MKVTLGQWLNGMHDACSDQMDKTFSEAEQADFKGASDRRVYGGYLMGTADAVTSIRGELERAHLIDRRISLPAAEEPLPEVSRPEGTLQNPVPLTVGGLRAFLACRPELDDDVPVVVGGEDFDDPARQLVGMADAVWTDTEGAFGIRLCVAAVGIGLADS